MSACGVEWEGGQGERGGREGGRERGRDQSGGTWEMFQSALPCSAGGRGKTKRGVRLGCGRARAHGGEGGEKGRRTRAKSTHRCRPGTSSPVRFSKYCGLWASGGVGAGGRRRGVEVGRRGGEGGRARWSVDARRRAAGFGPGDRGRTSGGGRAAWSAWPVLEHERELGEREGTGYRTLLPNL